MAEQEGDKTEAPTPRRRQEAREQGNIARSPDVTSAALMLAVLLLLSVSGPRPGRIDARIARADAQRPLAAFLRQFAGT